MTMMVNTNIVVYLMQSWNLISWSPTICCLWIIVPL